MVHLSLVDVSRKWAVDKFAPGRGPGPVAKVTSRRVGTLQNIAILALVQSFSSVPHARYLKNILFILGFVSTIINLPDLQIYQRLDDIITYIYRLGPPKTKSGRGQSGRILS